MQKDMKNIKKLNLVSLAVVIFLLTALYTVCSAATVQGKSIRSGRYETGKVTAVPNNDIRLNIGCAATENCWVEVRNLNPRHAYHNIWFEIEYEGHLKNGKIEDVILPGQKGVWTIDLIFASQPAGIKIKLLNANPYGMQTTRKGKGHAGKLASSDILEGRQVKIVTLFDRKKGETWSSGIVPNRKNFVSMRFFESGQASLPYPERQYQNEFSASGVRFINWELIVEHPSLGKEINYKVEAFWKNRNGSVFNRQTVQTGMGPDWELGYTTCSLGVEDAGKGWLPGSYSVELRADGRRIAEGYFRVVE
jgi:hypothetical protein